VANIRKEKGLNLQKISPMEAEKAGGLLSKVANSNTVNGCGNEFKNFSFETEF
jgi:hypothetical protein